MAEEHYDYEMVGLGDDAKPLTTPDKSTRVLKSIFRFKWVPKCLSYTVLIMILVANYQYSRLDRVCN
jgi:hypothetical protein